MCIVILVIICVMGKYFAVAIPVIAIILWGVQLYYLRTSRQVRLLDIEAKAPDFGVLSFPGALSPIFGVVSLFVLE